MRGLPATNFSEAFRGAWSKRRASAAAVARTAEPCTETTRWTFVPALAESAWLDRRVDVRRRELRRVELDLRAVDDQGQRLRERRLHGRGRSAGRQAADPDPCDPNARGDCVAVGARRRGGRQDPRCDYTEHGCERRSRTPVEPRRIQCSQDAHCHLRVVAHDRIDAEAREHLDPRRVVDRPRDDSGAARPRLAHHGGGDERMMQSKRLGASCGEQLRRRAPSRTDGSPTTPARTSGAGQEIEETPWRSCG